MKERKRGRKEERKREREREKLDEGNTLTYVQCNHWPSHVRLNERGRNPEKYM